MSTNRILQAPIHFQLPTITHVLHMDKLFYSFFLSVSHTHTVNTHAQAYTHTVHTHSTHTHSTHTQYTHTHRRTHTHRLHTHTHLPGTSVFDQL